MPKTAINLTYSFLSTPPRDASSEDSNGFAAMNSLQRDAARAALAKWASVANIAFSEVLGGGQIQFGTNDQGSRSSAYAYLPEPGLPTTYLYLNNKSSSSSNFADGSYGATVMLHELGHTLGLKHPGNYDSGGSTIGGPYLPASTDTVDYTQMSYNPGVASSKTGKYATTPMLYDIQAMQYLYGANMSYHSGDDVYSFSAAQPAMCIWDAGGADTLDFSACTGRVVINLNAGQFSETAPGLNNVSIAYGVTVESVIAGSGGSTIYGNAAGNYITGGGGADVVYQGAGNDRIIGGEGTDTVVYNGAFSQYKIVRQPGSVTVQGEGNDTLSSVELLRFSDRTMAVADLPILVTSHLGTAGPDRFAASGGGESFDGGAGLDTVSYGGARAAYTVVRDGATFQVRGQAGTDVLTGIERLQFGDGALALDSDATAGQLYRLYLSTYARTPDEGGMGFWLEMINRGVNMETVANAFITSAEFYSIYGRNLDDDRYVNQLYFNILHRDPDPGGKAFYVNALHNGISREVVLLSISDSPELKASLVGIMPDAIAYQAFG
ncbi:DUF4214 domain-containing protein [Pseudoduganella violacea]|uniref:Peptidase metallopeptidase domain-containing protein n=1 Tax=Pseudoduganella violacea TaxID=1715466 RepID=A0A7W5BFT5_9BURK|nr:DUF4214 domain-containing protein [Pseudoduganella violacea]MBB3122081.1 hypothetical protein [Pseudoduganella violacea]